MRASIILLALAAPATAGPGVLVQAEPGHRFDARARRRAPDRGRRSAGDAPDVVDGLVRWETGARDVVHGALDHLVTLSDGLPIPDLTILTTAPIPKPRRRAELRLRLARGSDQPRHALARRHRLPREARHAGARRGDGVVLFAGSQGGYGQRRLRRSRSGVPRAYAHLSRILVKKDATITAGQTVGKVGSTGRATGPHLHFEVRLDGNPVSPILAMNVAELQRDRPTSPGSRRSRSAPNCKRTLRQPTIDRASRRRGPTALVTCGKTSRCGSPSRATMT